MSLSTDSFNFLFQSNEWKDFLILSPVLKHLGKNVLTLLLTDYIITKYSNDILTPNILHLLEKKYICLDKISVFFDGCRLREFFPDEICKTKMHDIVYAFFGCMYKHDKEKKICSYLVKTSLEKENLLHEENLVKDDITYVKEVLDKLTSSTGTKMKETHKHNPKTGLHRIFLTVPEEVNTFLNERRIHLSTGTKNLTKGAFAFGVAKTKKEAKELAYKYAKLILNEHKISFSWVDHEKFSDFIKLNFSETEFCYIIPFLNISGIEYLLFTQTLNDGIKYLQMMKNTGEVLDSMLLQSVINLTDIKKILIKRFVGLQV